MKFIKWIAIVLVVLVLLVVVGVLILLNSSVQKSLVMGQLEGKAQHVELEYIKAGFSSATVKGLVVDQDGTLIELPSAEINYSLSDIIFGSKLVISKLEVTDLAVTLPAARERLSMGPGPVVIPQEQKEAAKPYKESTETYEPAEEKEESGPPPPFEGLFTKAAAPMPIYIDGVSVNASVKMTPQQSLTFKATGGEIAPGKTGSINADAVMTDKSAEAAAGEVNLNAVLKISQTDDQRLNAILLTTKTTAKGGSLSEPASLDATVDLSNAENSSETYIITLTDGSTDEELINFKTHFDPEKKKLNGKANFFIKAASLSPFIATTKIPGFWVKGTASFNLDSDDYEGPVTADARGAVNRLQRLSPKYQSYPDTLYTLQYDGHISVDSITSNTAKLILRDKDKNVYFDANLLQPVTVGKDFDPTKLKGKLLELSIVNFQLPWIDQMVDAVGLKNGILNGALEIEAENGNVNLKTSKTFKLTDLTVIKDSKRFIEGVNTELQLKGTVGAEDYNIAITQLNATDKAGKKLVQAGLHVDGKINEGKPVGTNLTMNAKVAFAPILEQPFSTQQLAQPVDLTLNLKASQPNEETLSVDQLSTKLITTGNKTLATVALLKPLELNIEKPESNTPETLMKGETLQIQILELPRPILNAFLGDIQLKSGNVTADLVVKGSGSDIEVISKKPLTATNLTVTKSNEGLINNLSASLSPTIVYNPNKTVVKLADIELSEGKVPLASGHANVIATPGGAAPLESADFSLDADLAQLLNQPVFSNFNNLVTGKATLNGKVTNPQSGEYSISIDGKNFKVAQPAGTIQSISLTASGKLEMPTLVTLNAPLTVVGPKGTSSLKLKGWVKPENKPLAFKFDTTGDNLFVDDLQLLSAAFKKPVATPTASTTQKPSTTPVPAPAPKQPTATPPGASKPAPGGPPPWADYQGTATLKINKVVHGLYTIENIDGALKVDPNTLSINPAKANFMGAPLDATVDVLYEPAKRRQNPYMLDSKFSFVKFDVGKYLTLTKPGTPPQLTGLFTVEGSAKGYSPALETITDKVQGQFSLTGGPGRLSALAGLGEGTNTALGIAGALIGNRAKEIPQLISLLQRIDYDELIIKADRGSDLNVNLSTFLLKGPEVRMAGKGDVKHIEGTPLQEQPLSIAVALDSKGKVAELMTKLGMVTGKTDAAGYLPGPSFNITGTPANPDFSGLYKIITSATGNVINNLLGPKDQSDTSSEPKKPSTEDTVKDAIRGLFGN